MSVNCEVGPVRLCTLARWKFGFLTPCISYAYETREGSQPSNAELEAPRNPVVTLTRCIGGFAEEMREGSCPTMADREALLCE